jgi:hypothetical protein
MVYNRLKKPRVLDSLSALRQYRNSFWKIKPQARGPHKATNQLYDTATLRRIFPKNQNQFFL